MATPVGCGKSRIKIKFHMAISNATQQAEDFPNHVTAAWPSERFNLSRKTIIEKVGISSKGDAQ